MYGFEITFRLASRGLKFYFLIKTVCFIADCWMKVILL